MLKFLKVLKVVSTVFKTYFQLMKAHCRGAHFGHFHNMYVMYFFTKCVASLLGDVVPTTTQSTHFLMDLTNSIIVTFGLT
jgi:hypothetical protein